MNEYICLAEEVTGETVIKKSKFICNIVSANTDKEAISRITEIKKIHYNATHNCFAIVLEDGYIKYSDDGEPQGTAGLPMMDVIKHSGIKNVATVVTRYFGGTLLGTGGLTRAYSNSVAMCIKTAKLVKMAPAIEYEFNIEYGDYSKLCSIAGEYATQVDGVFTQKVKAKVVLEKQHSPQFEKRITEAFLGKKVFEITQVKYIKKFL